MANIILPEVSVLETIKDSAKLLVEQDGSINRFAVADFGSGDITVDLSGEAIEGELNGINAITLNGKQEHELSVANSKALNGYSADEYVRRDELGDLGGDGGITVTQDISINMDNINPGTPSTINADTLNGKAERELSVAKAMDADTLANIPAENYAQKEYVNNKITNRIIYSGGKNLLKNTAISKSINGVTFTVNNDGSIIVNGESSAMSDFYFWGSITDTGNYLFIPKGSRIVGKDLPGLRWIAREKTAGAVLTLLTINALLAERDCYFYGIFFRAEAGTTADNYIIYPMIIAAGETDDTYEPYYEGLKSLTDRGMDLLWENISPTSSFSSQTVQLSLNGVTKIEIVFQNKLSDGKSSSHIAYKSTTEWNFHSVDNSGKSVTRYLSFGNNSVYFGNGYEYGTYGSYSQNNEVLIPHRIYGFKEVI